MAAIDIVNRVMREFRRYTGDGLPGEPTNAPLPVGDPQSGVHNPKKGEMRAAMLAPITESAAAAQAVIDSAMDGINDAVETAEASAELARQFADSASEIAIPPGTIGPTKITNVASEQKAMRTKLGSPSAVVSKSNLLPHGSFAQGWDGWATPSNSANALTLLTVDTDTSGTLEQYFSRVKMQLSAEAAARNIYVGSSRPIRVNSSQGYSLGAGLTTYGGATINADLRVKCYDENMALVGTLNVSVAVPNGTSTSGINSFFRGAIGPAGGAGGGFSAFWPAGTVAAIPQVGFVSTSSQGLNVFALWLIGQDEYPGAVATFGQANNGGGTHEAVADANNLYVLNHGFNWLVKFDADMRYVAHISIGDYPHDIVSIGNKLWVTNQDDMNVRRVDKATFAIDATYSIPGSRMGFGLATDGARLWSGAGTTAQTPAIHEVNTATGAMTMISTDVDGGGANLPVRFLAGSLWSVKQAPSEVKRINPAGGATIATINAGVGGIYGLGAGEGYVFANGRNGVAQIDPATNTVVRRYWYRDSAIGQSNIEVRDGRAYACTSSGVMVIDIGAHTSMEIILDAGNNKWARALPGGDVVIGAYAAPWLFRIGN